MSTGRPRRREARVGTQSVIPDKLYFKIGEVADLVGVQPHVLRYWEKEVPAIKPVKSSTNQRRYRRRDIEIFREIRRLLYEERYTLNGAKKHISDPSSSPDLFAAQPEKSEMQVPGLSAAEVDLLGLEQASSHPSRITQLPLVLGDSKVGPDVERLRAGLIDLIRFVGEEP